MEFRSCGRIDPVVQLLGASSSVHGPEPETKSAQLVSLRAESKERVQMSALCFRQCGGGGLRINVCSVRDWMSSSFEPLCFSSGSMNPKCAPGFGSLGHPTSVPVRPNLSAEYDGRHFALAAQSLVRCGFPSAATPNA